MISIARSGAEGIYAIRDGLQRVDVETTIGFVENAGRGCNSAICNTSLRFFAARKSRVDRSLQHVVADAERPAPCRAPA